MTAFQHDGRSDSFEPHVPEQHVSEHAVEASLLSLPVASTWRQKESRHSPSLAWTGTGLKPRRQNVRRVTDRGVPEGLRNGSD